MAIFKGVGCFIFVFLKESASLVLLTRSYTLQTSRQADKQTRKKQKINEGNRTGKHKWKHAKHNHVQVKPANQIPSGIQK
jgi:hypothetical protein